MKERQRAKNNKAIFASAFASIMVAFCLTPAPANAVLLHGYCSDSTSDQQERLLNVTKVVDSGVVARRDSFPVGVAGSWQCVTLVTDSLVETVSAGQKIVSRMDFVKTNDGRVVARFQQPGWTEAQESVTAFSPTQYQMDKTNYYYGDHANGAWAARSRDHYQLVERNRMIAESEIDQYINGRYVGRYHTRSTLFRLDTGLENVAVQQMPDPDDQSGDAKPGF
jgi:hypothetical protein